MFKFYAKNNDEAEITIYGDIGESLWSESKSASQFKKELDNLGSVKNIRLSIQSGGGSVFDALAIYNMLKRHQAKKIVYIDGLAASAASFIAMVGDEIIIPKNAYIMVHNAWSCACGNKEEFRKKADLLEQLDETITNIYVDKTNKNIDEITKMMLDETWIDGAKAVELGFADTLEEEIKIAASIDGDFLICNDQKVDTKNFKNFESVKNNFEPYREEQTPQPVAIDLSEQTKEFRNLKLKLLGGM